VRVESAEPCRCEWADKLNHDDLLRIESMPFRELVEFITTITSSPDVEEDPRLVSWQALGEFVGPHSWSDPVAVYELFHHLEFLTRVYARPTDDGLVTGPMVRNGARSS
jgi:hypothetical protein